MSRTPRTSLSPRLRFEVFKRDHFQCVYCGSTPMQAALHVDHVLAVAQGGTDDPSNLVTACAACNLGKSDVPLDQTTLAERLTAAEAADHVAQLHAYLAHQQQIAEARISAIRALCTYWEQCCGTLPADLYSRMARLCDQWPLATLYEAIAIVGGNGALCSQHAQIRYFYGVLRNRREVQ